jgi:aldehyde:ferredoxin oxidoreductase
MLDEETIAGEYVAAMEWDPKSAKPGKKKLEELGLDDVARVLWP